MATKLYVVVGGQYGSEAKGAVAGRICADLEQDGVDVVCVRVGGPNAGHTVIGRCPPDCEGLLAHQGGGHPWRLRQVPVAAVTAPQATLVIAAGSEVDPQVLADEVRELDQAGYEVASRLIADRSATVLTTAHIKAEQTAGLAHRIGSTAKGIGAARRDRIMREAWTWDQWADAGACPAGMALSDTKALQRLRRIDTGVWMSNLLRNNDNSAVVVEGTQGYGLGLHTDNYPKTTSGDCRAIDFLGSAGLSPWQTDANGWQIDLKVVIAVRPHPIRVAGASGDLPGETTWEALGLPAEYTTVTQKVRRVGAWDPHQVREAISANGGPRQGVVWLAFTMADSVEPKLAGVNGQWRNWVCDDDYSELVYDTVRPYLVDLEVGVQHLAYVGTGPGTAIVRTRLYE